MNAFITNEGNDMKIDDELVLHIAQEGINPQTDNIVAIAVCKVTNLKDKRVFKNMLK